MDEGTGWVDPDGKGRRGFSGEVCFYFWRVLGDGFWGVGRGGGVRRVRYKGRGRRGVSRNGDMACVENIDVKNMPKGADE